jgi:maltose/moltooligosaccharide transporter
VLHMKFNYPRTLLIGFAFMSISAFWQLYENFVPLILTNAFGVEPTARGTIMAMDNLLALFMLPLFGVLSDKCNTKLGKRMPFIIFGTAAAIVSMISMALAADGVKFIVFIVSLGLALVSMGTYRSPAVALMPDLTPPPLRSKANAIINLMGALGGVYTLAFIKMLVKDDGSYIPIFVCVAALMAISVIILTFAVNERKIKARLLSEGVRFDDKPQSEQTNGGEPGKTLPRDVKRSLWLLLASVFLWFTAYNAVTSVYSVYAQRVWGLKDGDFASGMMVAMIAAVIAFVPIGYISSAIGRKKVILAGIVMIAAAYGGMLFVKSYSGLVYVLLVTVGVGWASINVNSYPMVVQMGSVGDIGKYTGIYYTFSMTAQSITPILSGWFIEMFGYKVLFPYALFFSLAAFVVFFFVRHGDSKPAKNTSLLENYE